jgi:hypothetical protein
MYGNLVEEGRAIVGGNGFRIRVQHPVDNHVACPEVDSAFGSHWRSNHASMRMAEGKEEC